MFRDVYVEIPFNFISFLKIDKTNNQTMYYYLRVGSNPVINSGHNVCADAPANVSGQHDHPSQVPLQYFSKTIRKRKFNTMFHNIKHLYIIRRRNDGENKIKAVSVVLFSHIAVCLGKLVFFRTLLNKYFGFIFKLRV